MSIKVALPEDKKLCFIYRLESGCLGPDGNVHINKFCVFAQKRVESIESNSIIWEILSRNDKSLPEMEYKINNKILSYGKAEKYLEILNINIGEIEDQFHEKISNLIEEYFESK